MIVNMSTNVKPEDLYDAGDAGKVTRKKQSVQFSRDNELSELRHILGTEGGRKFLFRLLGECRLYHPVETMVEEGKRRVGLWVLSEIEQAAPNSYLMMQSDNNPKGKH